jgi:hypothetical protein
MISISEANRCICEGAEVFELGDQPSSVRFVGATFAPTRAEVGVSKRRDPVSSKVQQGPHRPTTFSDALERSAGLTEAQPASVAI